VQFFFRESQGKKNDYLLKIKMKNIEKLMQCTMDDSKFILWLLNFLFCQYNNAILDFSTQ